MEKETFYLSKAGYWGFSGKFSEPDSQQSDGPFGNFRDALEKISELRREGKISPIEVIIKGGVYRLEEPLVFPPAYSGDITFKAAEAEEVILTSNKIIEHFEEIYIDGKTLWKTFLPLVKSGEWNFKTLFVNGQWRSRSSFPKGKPFYIKDIPGHPLGKDDTGAKSFYLSPEDVAPLGDLTGAEIVVSHLWRNQRMPIVSYDAATGYVESDRYSLRLLKDELPGLYARYQVENTLGGLTEPGEWHLNAKTGELYYMPMEGETLETTVIEAPTCPALIVIEGSPDTRSYVKGLHFENIIFNGADYEDDGLLPERTAHMYRFQNKKYACSPQAAFSTKGAVYLRRATDCSFTGCTFQNFGGWGIDINESCSYIRVSDCEISSCGAGGVRITGGDCRQVDSTKTGFNLIENNSIHDLTKIFYGAVGIGIFDSFSNCLRHNDIYNLKYSGISSGWVWGMQESNTHHNTIEYNHIHHLGDGTLSDMGGIYLLGEQPGTVVRYNHIHHIVKANYGGWGIYLDEGSAFIVVEKNVVHHLSCEPFNIHFAKENIIRYNIFAFGEEGQVRIGKSNSYNSATLTKNIILTDDKPIYGGGYAYIFRKDALTTDGNFVWNIGSKPYFIEMIHHRYQGKKLLDLEEWKEMGFDVFSRFEDPGFEDYTLFKLREDSYVYEYGFPRDVDASAAGRKQRR